MADTVTPRGVRQINGRKAGLRTNSYENLAMRLVHGWAELSDTQQDVIRGMLRPVITKHRTTPAK